MNARFALASLIAALAGSAASAANVTFVTPTPGPGAFRRVTQAEINDSSGALTSAYRVFEFRVNSPYDILSVNNVVISLIGGTAYQHPLGSETEPPLDAFVNLFPSLGADSWITTPAATSRAGAQFGSDPNNLSSYFDLSPEVTPANFLFARITTNAAHGTFSGRISIGNASEFRVEDFNFTYFLEIPEPATAPLVILGLMIVGTRLRSNIAHARSEYPCSRT